MRIREVEFAGAIGAVGQTPPLPLPQIAIAGRSNVGKSSLINALVGRKRIARVSKRPGKTQEINFYRVNDRFLLVDLPGYGFAKAPPQVRDRWADLLDGYLCTASRLIGLVLLLDCRRRLTEGDGRMLEYLETLGLPALFVLTKIDKLGRTQRRKAEARWRETLGVPADQLLSTSAQTGEGIRSLRDSLFALVDAHREDTQ